MSNDPKSKKPCLSVQITCNGLCVWICVCVSVCVWEDVAINHTTIFFQSIFSFSCLLSRRLDCKRPQLRTRIQFREGRLSPHDPSKTNHTAKPRSDFERPKSVATRNLLVKHVQKRFSSFKKTGSRFEFVEPTKSIDWQERERLRNGCLPILLIEILNEVKKVVCFFSTESCWSSRVEMRWVEEKVDGLTSSRRFQTNAFLSRLSHYKV